MRLANSRWLEDTSLRLICVLSKDRFGDFVSGYEVVAPVRESCAQALGAVLRWASHDMVERLSEFLLHLMGQKEWQARHGGLLAVKYLLMVRKVCRPDSRTVWTISLLSYFCFVMLFCVCIGQDRSNLTESFPIDPP